MTLAGIRPPQLRNDTGCRKHQAPVRPAPPAPGTGHDPLPPVAPGRRPGEGGPPAAKPPESNRWGAAVFAIALLLWPALLPHAHAAREDSASLTLQKTAGHRKTRLYVVKKGEFLSGIFRSQLGDEPVPIALIRQLNPEIRDLNKIYPGQRLLLPIREITDFPAASTATRDTDAPPMRDYRIRETDSISRIILEELHAREEEVLTAYRLLRRLNPDIADLNSLPPGGTLKLPLNFTNPEGTSTPPVQTAPPPVEIAPPASALSRNAPPNAEGLLGMIRPVISRMKGTITAAGYYYIPLKESAQVTIDCALIPIVEMDDGTTVLLDFGNRLSEDLKRLITQSWANYTFLSAGELRDDLTAIQEIIRRSRNYTIARADRPLTVASKPEVLAFPDWVIAAKKAVAGQLYRQALFLLGANERSLPPEAVSFLEKTGLTVTEITTGSTLTPPSPPPAPAAPDLRELKGVVFAERLLETLGEKPVRNAAIVIFDQATDGFNLSVTADLLIQRGGKRFLIVSKRLPEEFIRILKGRETEVFLLRAQGSGRSLIEELLGRLNIPVSFGHFSVRIPEEGPRPRLVGTFPALRALAGGDALYLIDFDVSADLLSLFQGRLGGRIAKY